MDDAARPDGLFAGDLDDPWVAAIAAALPASMPRMALVGDLPERWPAEAAAARTLVLHRPTLSITDFERFGRQRRAGLFPRLLLCVGPHARYAYVQPWAELAEAILPEATAAETIVRHLATDGPSVAPRRPLPDRPPIAVVSGDAGLGPWLVETCHLAGYRPRLARTWAEVPPARLAIWDVPVLEPRWVDDLAAQASHRVVIALLGLADRELVRLARSRGAAACLDLPCDPADLVFVLDRLTAGRARRDPAGRFRRDPGHPRDPEPDRVAWPAIGARPTMRTPR